MLHLLLSLVLLGPVQAPGDGVPATEAQLDFPLGLARTSDGALFVSERNGHRVRRIDPETGVITTFAGTGTRGFSGDGGPAHAAQLASPDSIDVDDQGNVYIADRSNERIRRVDAQTGTITTIAGTGERAFSEDGELAIEASLMGPFYVRVVDGNEVFFTDTDSHRAMRIDPESGILECLAGTGQRGYTGDGGYAFEATFARPHVVLRTSSGDIVIGDSFNMRVRSVDVTTGEVRTLAGNGEMEPAADGTPLLEASFGFFGEILELENGDLLLTEWHNGRVLRLDFEAGLVRVLAGTTDPQAPTESGHAPLETRFERLADCVFDDQGRLLVVATAHGQIRRIDFAAGTVETIAGLPPEPDEADPDGTGEGD